MYNNQNPNSPPTNQNDEYNSYPAKQKRPGMTNYYIC